MMASNSSKLYGKAERELLDDLAMAIVMADIEKTIIKPMLTEQGQKYQDATGFLAKHFENVPNSKQAYDAFFKAINKFKQQQLALLTAGDQND